MTGQYISELCRANHTMTTTFTMRRQGSKGFLTIPMLEDDLGCFGRYSRQPIDLLHRMQAYYSELFEYLVGTSNERVEITLDIAQQTAQFLKETN